jgi:hypothetical protein
MGRSSSRCWSNNVAGAAIVAAELLDCIIGVAVRFVQEGPHTFYPRAGPKAGTRKMRSGQRPSPMLDATVVRQKGSRNSGRMFNSRRPLSPDTGLMAGIWPRSINEGPQADISFNLEQYPSVGRSLPRMILKT